MMYILLTWNPSVNCPSTDRSPGRRDQWPSHGVGAGFQDPAWKARTKDIMCACYAYNQYVCKCVLYIYIYHIISIIYIQQKHMFVYIYIYIWLDTNVSAHVCAYRKLAEMCVLSCIPLKTCSSSSSQALNSIPTFAAQPSLVALPKVQYGAVQIPSFHQKGGTYQQNVWSTGGHMTFANCLTVVGESRAAGGQTKCRTE